MDAFTLVLKEYESELQKETFCACMYKYAHRKKLFNVKNLRNIELRWHKHNYAIWRLRNILQFTYKLTTEDNCAIVDRASDFGYEQYKNWRRDYKTNKDYNEWYWLCTFA